VLGFSANHTAVLYSPTVIAAFQRILDGADR
jgi:hypothetical protein